MKKIRLFTPGPTMVPEEVLLEMARPMEHHRTGIYKDWVKQSHELLQYVFQTKSMVVTITGSGTAAAEAAIVGCVTKGHKALVVDNGNFAGMSNLKPPTNVTALLKCGQGGNKLCPDAWVGTSASILVFRVDQS